MKLSVTIDGAAGTGKSVLSRALARKLSGTHYTTGRLYRVLGALALRYTTLDPEELLKHLDEPVDDAVLRQEETAEQASIIGADPFVRERVVAQQKKDIRRLLSQGMTVVLDGRDAGSVVWPEADCKFFLKADPEVCLQRRLKELGGAHDHVAALMRERDLRDRTRAANPLLVPEGALVLDVTHVNEQEVFAMAWQFLTKKIAACKPTSLS